MASMLNVLEPCSTGIGGDAFALYFDASVSSSDSSNNQDSIGNSKVSCYLGNGATGENISLETLKQHGFGVEEGLQPLDSRHGLAITVPGAAALWEKVNQHHGRLTMQQCMQPAIDLAESGFPVGPVTAFQWSKGYLQGDEALRVLRTPPDGYIPANSNIKNTKKNMKNNEKMSNSLPNPPQSADSKSTAGLNNCITGDATGDYPCVGDIMKNPDLAQTFKDLATLGAKDGFYNGRIGGAIIEAVNSIGGALTEADLDSHYTECVEPIRVSYKDHYIYECPPPTHGIAALLALNLLEALTSTSTDTDIDTAHSATRVHLEVECMRIAFADVLTYIGDPRAQPNTTTNTLNTPTSISIDTLLSKEYAQERCKVISSTKIATGFVQPMNTNTNSGTTTGNNTGNMGTNSTDSGNSSGSGDTDTIGEGAAEAFKKSDTVYFCVIDQHGNGCSFINSNYMGFGSGLMPTGCGFTLHNRGHNFSLKEGHPNCIASRKRPYHTIIPCLLTHRTHEKTHKTLGDSLDPMGAPVGAPMGDELEEGEELYSTMGVMGGFMQPQGHVQMVRHLLDEGLDPQEALDEPRWQLIQVDNSINGLKDMNEASNLIIEENFDNCLELQQKLSELGHNCTIVSGVKDRLAFGKGQCIVKNAITGCLSGGSDGRADGSAVPVLM